MIEPTLWAKLHGAATHFPIALALVSALCEAVAWQCWSEELRRKWRFAGTLTIVLAALGGQVAAWSGLFAARWRFWGHGTLLRHHQFVWPALALITALAIWRVRQRTEPTRLGEGIYVGLIFLAALLVGGAGYWGGEMLQAG